MYYDRKKLTECCTEMLLKIGVSRKDAQTVADVLAEADARGIASHGCVRMESYIECILSGGVRPDAQHTILNEGPGYARIDAGHGLGIPVSVEAMDLAIEKARATGIAIVNVTNSQHHGACGHYSLMASKQGMIGLAMSTGDVLMVATGGAERSLGNNPFSYSVPAGRHGAICYDIAMSTVAAGKISIAADEDRSIPLGWLLDVNGNPTTEPKEYDRGGALLPFGGYKGYGLCLMVESLAGILSGSSLLKDIHAWSMEPNDPNNAGHCFVAINPALINPGFDVSKRAEEMIDQLQAAKKAPGCDRILFPGELEQEKLAASEKEGIYLSLASEQSMRRAAKITGVPFIDAIESTNV